MRNKVYFNMRAHQDSVTDNFLIEISATPAQLVSLRHSRPVEPLNNIPRGQIISVLTDYCGLSGFRLEHYTKHDS